MEFALVNERFVNGVDPTIPLKMTLPEVPARKVSAVAPFNVLENVMVAPAAVTPPFVLSMVGAFATVTGPVKLMAPPLVVILPFTLIAVDPVYVTAPVVFRVEVCVIFAEVTFTLVNAVVAPTAPVNVVVPAPALIVKGPAPLTVLLNATLPPEVVRLKVSPVGIVTGPPKVIGPLFVMMLQVVTPPV